MWGANYFITFCAKTETKIDVVIVIEKVPDPIYLALDLSILCASP